MTNQNNAAQAAAQILTYLGFAQAVSMEPGADRRRDQIQGLIESAMLPTLRAPVASAEVMDALNWVDDFIARCNRDDRGSCESVNVLRRALASAPEADDGLPDVLPEYTNESGAQFVSMATVQTVLRAARAALASASAPNQATSGGRNMFYEGLFEGETERQRNRRLKWMKTVPPAPIPFYRQSLRELVDVVWNEATESTAVPDTAWADRLIDRVFPSVLASAPVAGEARMPPGYRVKVVEGHGYRVTAPSGSGWVAHNDTPAGDLIAALLAAPQAGEAVRDEETSPIMPDDEEIAGACINASDIDGIAYDGRSFERGYRAALSAQPGAQKEQNDAG